MYNFIDMEKGILTTQEMLFCQLYANGEAPFAGNMSRSYEAAYGETSNARNLAKALLKRAEIQEYLNELYEGAFEEARYMKQYIATNLMRISSECSELEIYDKKGRKMSPAAARSVAVNALKTLMDR